MQVLKYCILFTIFILSNLIGKYSASQYIERLRELEEIRTALNIFKTKIKFTYNPIPEIFEEISINIRGTNNNISKLFAVAKEKMIDKPAQLSWEEAVEEYSGNINKEDKQVLKTLSKLLRYNRYRRANKSNRSDRKILRKSDKTSRI